MAVTFIIHILIVRDHTSSVTLPCTQQLTRVLRHHNTRLKSRVFLDRRLYKKRSPYLSKRYLDEMMLLLDDTVLHKHLQHQKNVSKVVDEKPPSSRGDCTTSITTLIQEHSTRGIPDSLCWWTRKEHGPGCSMNSASSCNRLWDWQRRILLT